MPKHPLRSCSSRLAAALAAAVLAACGGTQAAAERPDGAASITGDPVPQVWSTVVSSTAPLETVPATIGFVAPDGTEFTDGFPFTLTVRSSGQPDFAPIVLDARAAERPDAQNMVFTVPCPAQTRGTFDYTATLAYSLCTATRCVRGEVDARWTINVH